MRRLLFLILFALITACSLPAEPTSTSVDYPPLPDNLTPARFARVVDGDTIIVRINGVQERVRLIGIDTPESADPRRPVQCFGREAAEHARQLLNGATTVWLEEDPSQDSRDRFGRLLRYVWLEDGRMINLEQIAQGFAYEYTYDVPYRYQAIFKAAEQEARAAQRGLWSPETCNGRR